MGYIIYYIRPGLINPSWTLSTHKYANKTNTSINIALAQRTLDLSTFTQQLINQSGDFTFIIISLSASVNIVKRIYFTPKMASPAPQLFDLQRCDPFQPKKRCSNIRAPSSSFFSIQTKLCFQETVQIPKLQLRVKENIAPRSMTIGICNICRAL